MNIEKNLVKKRYGIKTTDKETLRRWYYLLYLGRLLDEKAPSYLLQSIGWQCSIGRDDG